MKLERLLGIIMILINQKGITAKALASRFSVSIRTIQRDMEVLSVSGIPILSTTGPNGGYSLLDNYTINKTFLKKEELRLLTDLLNGLEKIISSTEVKYLSDKMKAISGEEVSLINQHIRFDFTPWLPHHSIKEKLEELSEAILSHEILEITYRDQKGNKTLREVEAYQLWMKDYAWYVYCFCSERKDYRAFKINRIEAIKPLGQYFQPRDFIIEDPFKSLKGKLIPIKLKFNLTAIGRLEDYFSFEDIKYYEDYIMIETLYPDDEWLDQILLSFGNAVEVISPLHIIERIKKQAFNIYQKYVVYDVLNMQERE
jgi:predicted DNA-binding transcriptional regulator YafY